MSVSRRGFFKTVGWSSAGFSTSWLAGRTGALPEFGSVLAAAEPAAIRLSNNENNRGPGSKATEAAGGDTARMGRGYPPDHVNELVDAIAAL